jgi:predicted nucleic acid-binding protein
MSDKYFLDTSIFIYSFDKSDKKKQKTSMSLINSAIKNNLGVISYQVVQEFLNVALSKFEKPISSKDAGTYLQNVMLPLCEFFPSIPFYEKSLIIKDDTGFSFYDSLIVTAALESNCTILYTEDLQHERIVRELTIRNPFFK